MGSVVLAGATSGSTTITPTDAVTATLTLPSTTGTLGLASGSATQSINAQNTFGFKNRIINGGMVIAQRGTSATNPTNGAGSPGYTTIDRLGAWADTALNTSWTIQQSSSAPTGFSSSALITSTAASTIGVNSYDTINQSIEAFNTSDLLWGTANAKSCTFSFWVNCSLTGTFAGYVYNNGYSYCYPFTYSIPTANTWTFITISIPGPTGGTWLSNNNGLGLQVGLTMASGSGYYGTANTWQAGSYRISASGAVNLLATNGATFYTTGWQFEVGSQATSFDFRDYGRELILCQRYYTQFGVTSAYEHYGIGVAQTNTSTTIMNLPVTMRTAPTFAFLGSFSNYIVLDGSTAYTPSAIAADVMSLNVCSLAITITGVPVGRATRFYRNASSLATLTYSAEL
jgi:hypothetical protein